MAINRRVPLQHPKGWAGWVIAKLIHGDRKEWVTRHSQWKVLPHDDASSTGLSALFQLCWGLSTLGPYGPLRNRAPFRTCVRHAFGQ